MPLPGFVALNPGYEEIKRRKWIAGRRGIPRTGTQAAHRARRGYGGLRRPSASGALACRRSTTALAAATERHRSAPVHALPGGGTTEERPLSVPCRPSAAGFNPQTGRSAGRAFWPRAAREPRLTRPKPAGTVLAPSHRRHPAVSFLGRDSSRYVAIPGTFVNDTVTRYSARHARTCCGHPRFRSGDPKTWMAGTSQAMTKRTRAKSSASAPSSHTPPPARRSRSPIARCSRRSGRARGRAAAARR